MSSDSADFQMSFRPSSAPQALPTLALTSASVDATLLPRYMKKDRFYVITGECMHCADLIVAHVLGLLCIDIETNVT